MRVFDAPRELVFRAWSDAQALARWWGPRGCMIKVYQLDLRPGGISHYSMRRPDGQEMFGKFAYREIAAREPMQKGFGGTFDQLDEYLAKA
jgi:uncharacterized protein YndB with AHSA1/START domain